jgi:hypothetical protein
VDDNEQLRQWIQEKLDEGYSKDRLKEIAENRDLDPSVVDEVSNSRPDFQAFGDQEEGGTAQDKSGEATGSEQSGDDTSLLDKIPSMRYLVVALGLLVAAAAGVVFAFGEINGDTTPVSSSGEEDLPRGCSDVGDIGIRINEVSVSAGATSASVETIRGDAWIRLEVYRDGELRSSERQYIEVSGDISVGAVGDRVVAHPVNCNLYRDSVEY